VVREIAGRPCVGIAGFLLAIAIATPALAADGPAPIALPPPIPDVTLSTRAPTQQTDGEALDLAACLTRALQKSPLLDAARAGTDAFKAKLDQAESFQWPHIRVDAFASPMPGRRGTVLSGYTDWDQWGAFLYTEINGYVPLYGFGKIRHLKKAARLGVQVGRAQEQIARAEVRFRVLKAYFGLMFARELQSVMDEGHGYFEKARRHMAKMKESDDPSFDPVDEMKIRVFDAQFQSRDLESRRLLALALANLRYAMGEDPQSGPDVATGEASTIQPLRSVTLVEAIEAAIAGRPELVALRTGVAARSSEVDARYWHMYPDFVVAGRFTAAYCNVADKPSSPFANNPYNGWSGGAGLGLRWDLDLARKLGEWREAKAVRNKLMADMDEADHGVRLEVEKLFREMTDAHLMVGAQQDALKAARGWVVSKLDLYENDLATLRDVMDGLLPFFQSRLDLLKAMHDYDVSVAALERSAGLLLVPVNGTLQDGQAPSSRE
jgi:outer membrane protein TolC